MILQCDQCSTKFRLDDARLKPGGVKVRCSKCRHVFLAGADFKHEESEFDAILSGLGAPAAAKTGSDEVSGGGLEPAGFGFDSESVPGAPAPAAPIESAKSAAAPVAPVAAPAESAAPFALPEFAVPLAPAKSGQPEQVAPASVAESFSFNEAPAPSSAESSVLPDSTDFAAFDFPSEPFDVPKEPFEASKETFEVPKETFEAPKKPAPLTQPVTDFSAFDFAPAPPPEQKKEAESVAGGLDYGEFTFDEEPAQLKEEPTAVQDDAFDFSEFSFADEPVTPKEQAAPAALDFSEFDFDAHPPATEQEPETGLPDLDYGDFTFPTETPPELEAAAPPQQGKDAPAAAEDAFDFGAFSFSEEPPPLREEEPAAAKQDFEFGEFSFAEETPLSKEPAVAPEASQQAAAFSFPEASEPSPTPAPPVSKAAEDFSFDDFSFAPDPAAEPAPTVSLGEVAAPLAAELGPGVTQASAAPSHTSSAPPLALDGEAALDFGLGSAIPTRVSDTFELDEEALPPLSIASRRKGRSLVTVSIIAVSVLVIVALSGAGLYLLQSGPAAFDKLGIGFVAKWFGMESAEEGRITVKNQQAAFSQNKEAGELFVVTGEAVNSFRSARASILVRVSIFDKKGAVLLQKTAYCGNRLTAEQLATLPMSKIESVMNNPFGDSLSNLGVPSGSAIGFVVALPNVPKEAADFGVEVVGSTVAGKTENSGK
jgi:predicted Zn finger-like uncharacterized protein